MYQQWWQQSNKGITPSLELSGTREMTRVEILACRGGQPVARGTLAVQDGSECGPT